MSKTHLVIVESPAKAKTIEKYLGSAYTVKATVGHVIDLPPSKLGVDLDRDFEPVYEVIKGKKKVIDDIKKAAQKVTHILLAPDPDREGEAIAWHMSEILGRMRGNKPEISRVLFNEITKKAIIEAVGKPTKLNRSMFEAQQARRILDRLVGYKISPLLWDKVRRGLSAGRVQSVAVRLVCEREQEILAFKSDEYWSVEVKVEGSIPPPFTAKLAKKDGKNIEIPNADAAAAIKAELEKQSYILSAIQKREQKRNPSPPFITSKLQQEGARKLGFTAKKTMMLAQKLYEGMEIDGESVGLITYMRTDSTRVSPTALEELRQYIGTQFGKQYLPDEPHVYKSKKDAQDAHEAIRPTSMEYSPERVKPFLEKDEFRMYELIWKRFIASQMKPAVIDRTTFDITAGSYLFRANGSVIKFPGFMAVYEEGRDEEVKRADDQAAQDQAADEAESSVLPDLKEGETLKALECLPAQHFTQPPPRFTEASLVKELEEKGIGRPSTYASIMSVIQDKKYVDKDDHKRFRPTDLGKMVNDLLVAHFPEVLDVAFTAKMEGELDDVEVGKLSWRKALGDFYGPFTKALELAKVEMKDVKRQEILTDIVCEKCGSPMIIKFGRNGEFLACRTYPECKNTKEFRRSNEGKIEVQAAETTDEVCEKCQSPMVVKSGRFGKFLACSAYPACKTTKAISLGINCPLCAKGISARTSKRGKMFYGCTGYPNCKFASWDKPVNEPCPQCEGKYLVEKVTKSRGTEIRCPEEGCGYTRVGG